MLTTAFIAFLRASRVLSAPLPVYHHRQNDGLALSTIMLHRGTGRRSAWQPPVRSLQHIGFQMMLQPKLGHRFTVPPPDAFTFVGRDLKGPRFNQLSFFMASALVIS